MSLSKSFPVQCQRVSVARVSTLKQQPRLQSEASLKNSCVWNRLTAKSRSRFLFTKAYFHPSKPSFQKLTHCQIRAGGEDFQSSLEKSYRSTSTDFHSGEETLPTTTTIRNFADFDSPDFDGLGSGLGGGDLFLPRQGDAIVQGTGKTALAEKPEKGPDLSYLQELIAIQESGPKIIGFFGTRNMGFMHQQLIEILSYAMILTKNHIYTSGATGTNAAVIRGALRAEDPDLLTVVLPQSKERQPKESQDLLKKVKNVIEMPENDELTLIDASRLCNDNIVNRVQQIICFAFHDSNLLLETCREAKEKAKIVTLFYLD